MKYAELSREKRIILQMPDEAVKEMIKTLSKLKIKEGETNSRYPCGMYIPDEMIKKYENLKNNRSFRTDSEDAKWLRYFEKLISLSTSSPKFFTYSDYELYSIVKERCEEANLPEDFAQYIIPCLLEYAKNKDRMKPIIFDGSPGCGKTTAARELAEIMALEFVQISVSHASTSTGLAGESPSFRGANLGAICKALITTETLNPVILIDEIDKAPHPDNRASTDDELLSLCDGTGEIYENFLGFNIPTHQIPIIMTSNDIEHVSEPLRDRCFVYSFPEVSETRIIKIVDRYLNKKLSSELYSKRISLKDADLLHNVIVSLHNSGVKSIRKHEELIDNAIRVAFVVALENDNSVYLDNYLNPSCIQRNQKRNIGF